MDISHPRVIQGGMGIAVSSWQLAKEISQAGELGVISGTAIDSVIARRLQDGDIAGDVRRALAHYPDQSVATEILNRYFIENGRAKDVPYIDVPKLTINPSAFATNLLIAATFIEVWLAKEGHTGLVGMNILEKIQLAIPAQLFGAMLADVDYILIGAGIPSQIPRLLDQLALGHAVTMKVEVEDTSDKYSISLNPNVVTLSYPLKRPLFLAIVSSHALVAYLNRDEETKPDGYVIEYHVAGGHNAPPRAKNSIDHNGESVYADADIPNLEKVRASGSPFWLAGGFGTPEMLKLAIELGAKGIQVGTLFALSNESGLTEQIRTGTRNLILEKEIQIKTDATASPTGFPFKVVELENSLSDSELFQSRRRICDLGYLRSPFKRESGSVGYRCPGEPSANYEFKKGENQAADKSKCLCNALMADIGLGQVRPDGKVELPLVTLGSDLDGPARMAKIFPTGWNAKQALAFITE